MDNVRKFYNAIEINNMSGEEVANLFLNWHGTQLLTEDFLEFIEDEGYVVE